MSDRALVAAALLTAAFSVAGQSHGGLLEQAGAAYRDQRPAEAVRLYQQYLASGTDRADVRIYLGAALLNLGRNSEAMTEAKRAIELDPSTARAYTLAARIHAAERQWEEAQSLFAKAALLNPLDREVPYFAGRAYFDADYFEMAAVQFIKAIQLGARESRTYQNLGLCWEALNQPAKAEESYRLAVGSPGVPVQAFYRYGLFLYKQNRLPESERLLSMAHQATPDDSDTSFALARTLFRTGQLERAEETLKHARSSGDCRIHNLLLQIFTAKHLEPERASELKAVIACAAS